MIDLGYCDHDFHLDECNACGMSREDRDAPMIEVIGAVNYGDGYAQARSDLAERVSALMLGPNYTPLMRKHLAAGYEEARRDVLALIDALRPE